MNFELESTELYEFGLELPMRVHEFDKRSSLLRGGGEGFRFIPGETRKLDEL